MSSDNFLSGLGKVGLGVLCIAAVPIAVGVAASTAATIGACTISAVVATEASVIATGLTAIGVAETSVVTGGSLIAAKGAKEMAED